MGKVRIGLFYDVFIEIFKEVFHYLGASMLLVSGFKSIGPLKTMFHFSDTSLTLWTLGGSCFGNLFRALPL